jgi:hypothetical protein
LKKLEEVPGVCRHQRLQQQARRDEDALQGFNVILETLERTLNAMMYRGSKEVLQQPAPPTWRERERSPEG